MQKKALVSFAPLYCIEFREQILDFNDVYKNSNDTFLEIGFGMGHATIEIAERNPDKNYLGVEVHTPGVGRVLNEINTRKLDNLRIIRHDAVEVLEHMIGSETLNGVHLFFPDPWPKKKHFKRRLIQKEFVSSILPKLKPGGYIYAATDWEPYAEWILEVFQSFQELKNRYNPYADKIDWRPATSFERKGLQKNHKIRNIWFEKLY